MFFGKELLYREHIIAPKVKQLCKMHTSITDSTACLYKIRMVNECEGVAKYKATRCAVTTANRFKKKRYLRLILRVFHL
jgi:hypothetical protein